MNIIYNYKRNTKFFTVIYYINDSSKSFKGGIYMNENENTTTEEFERGPCPLLTQLSKELAEECEKDNHESPSSEQ